MLGQPWLMLKLKNNFSTSDQKYFQLQASFWQLLLNVRIFKTLFEVVFLKQAAKALRSKIE